MYGMSSLSSLFQSTHPRGVRLSIANRIISDMWVSIHAPARGATLPQFPMIATLIGFQSTHPRGVRLNSFFCNPHGCLVSIHAPARGATICMHEGQDRAKAVSIHAPARGATRILRAFRFRKIVLLRFQSTHPRGVRRPELKGLLLEPPVSIHAPARGATWLSASEYYLTTWFQSTHPRGVRHEPYGLSISLIWFQSTHPRGVRRAVLYGFNGIRRWFQSTHPRGVRRLIPQTSAKSQSTFQSTHPRGVRRFGLKLLLPRGWSFNPRTRAGCDAVLYGFNGIRRWFQSTHPRGVRRK